MQLVRKLSIAGVACMAWAWAASAEAAHAIAQYGTPKYPADFSHFDYVNPDAPKTGTVVLSIMTLGGSSGSFDTFNPFGVRGTLAPGVQDLMFETLTINSLDEQNTQYGLLAENIDVAPDFGSVTFRLRPNIRFSNGDPVTAEDVKYSFEVLTSRAASPRFRAYFSEIRQATVLDDRTIRFDFMRTGRDLSFVAGSLPVFSVKWGMKENGEKTPFDELRFEPPVTTGPYVLEKASDSRLSVTYIRNPDYWGRTIPVRRGSFNFERVVYKAYRGRDAQVAAMRGGEIDYFPESRMRFWCCQFFGKLFNSGELVKEKVPDGAMSTMNGHVYNLRLPRFQDKRVRRALNLLYDWDWLNRKLYENEFSRQDSYFANSPLAARGLPTAGELALLEPFRDQLDPEVFGPAVEQPSTEPPRTFRENIAEALQLLADAGWHNRDGFLRNAAGEIFELEIPPGNDVYSPFDAYIITLHKVGINVKTHLADPVAIRARLRTFDFQLTSIGMRQGRDPIPEIYRKFSSAEADRPGSENLAGLKSPVVDALIEKVQNADSQEDLQTAARALDRVLMHGEYVMPNRYLKNHYFMYHKRLRRPSVVPSNAGPFEWLFAAWWDGDEAP